MFWHHDFGISNPFEPCTSWVSDKHGNRAGNRAILLASPGTIHSFDAPVLQSGSLTACQTCFPLNCCCCHHHRPCLVFDNDIPKRRKSNNAAFDNDIPRDRNCNDAASQLPNTACQPAWPASPCLPKSGAECNVVIPEQSGQSDKFSRSRDIFIKLIDKEPTEIVWTPIWLLLSQPCTFQTECHQLKLTLILTPVLKVWADTSILNRKF